MAHCLDQPTAVSHYTTLYSYTGEYYFDSCNGVKITSVLNHIDTATTYMVGFDQLDKEEKCNVSICTGKCGDPDKSKNYRLTMNSTFEIDVHISNLIGENVTFNMEICDGCKPRSIYLPDYKPTG